MVIETKYGVRDKVFFISGSKIKEGTIRQVEVKAGRQGTEVKYWIDEVPILQGCLFYEDQLHLTKEDLIASL